MADRTWTPSQESAMNIRNKMLLVSAAAGSGKTSVLTERIIRLLTDKDSPADLSRILVVTFTRAAAAELKARISSALTAALAERPGDPHLSKQLFLLGSAQISTIDSFFQKAVRDNFEQLDIPAAFRLADQAEANEICLRVLDETIQELYARHGQKPASEDDPFSHLADNRFAHAMDDLLGNRSNADFDETLLLFYKKFASFPVGVTMLKDYAEKLRNSVELDFMESLAGASLRRYLLQACDYFLAHLQDTGDFLETDPDCKNCFGGVHEYDTSFFKSLQRDLSAGKTYDRIKGTVSGYQKIRFPSMRAKPAEMDFYKDLRTEIKKTIDDWNTRFFAYSNDEIRTQILRNAELCEMLYQLFAEYESRVWEEKKRRGILEFDDVRACLYRLLVLPSGTPSPFAESLSEQYDAVYIDEYQDVDFMQDQIFALIGKNRRFMVGDIKQSIYGFRGSEPTIFTGYRKSMPRHTEETAKDADAVCVFMSDNFRCNRPIIEYANLVCAFLFSGCEESVGYRPEDDLRFGKGRNEALPAAIPVQTVVFEGYPRRKAGDDTQDEERPNREAVWVASEIARLIREEKLDNGERISPSDITILVRNANQGIPFLDELKKIGIPVSAAVGDDIANSPLMTDLLNLLRAIDNPHRDLPLSEYLLSQSGGFTLEELDLIRQICSDQYSLYDALCQASKLEDFPYQTKCAKWVAWLEGFQKLAAVQPADRFLRLLYADPSLIAYSASTELLVLYEYARSYQRNAWCGLFGFLQYFERLIEGNHVSCGGFRAPDSSVRVMTMHTSKGLEYPVVFLCSCEKRFNTKSLEENLLFHRKFPCASRCFNPATSDNDSGILREVAKLEIQAEEAEENIRLLYVALTRARERLYVTGTPDGNYDNLMSSARRILRDSGYSILYYGNFLRWILAALQQKENKNAEFPCTFRHIPLSEEVKAGASQETTSTDVQTPTPMSGAISEKYSAILEKQNTFVYPLEQFREYPTKLAASKLSSDLLDHISDTSEDEAALEEQIHLLSGPAPTFETLLGKQKTATAADIGTATHAFLEFCDFENFSSAGIDAEILRLIEKRFLSPETADLINRDQLNLFLKSRVMKWILDAEKIYKEQQFNLSVPLSALTASKEKQTDPLYQNETVLVQGSIDLLLRMKDGRLLLIDYKTDHVFPAERKDFSLLQKSMTEKHVNQLSCYALAVKRMFGRIPNASYIYSLPLGTEIPIEVEA